MSAAPRRSRNADDDGFRSLCGGFRGPNHPEERESRAWRAGYEAGRLEASHPLTYAQVEKAAKNLICETFTWINEGDDDEQTNVARRRMVLAFADELGLTVEAAS